MGRSLCALIALRHTCSLRPDSYRIDLMPKIKVRDRTRTGRKKNRSPQRPSLQNDKRSGKRNGKDEARPNRVTERRRLKLFQSFKSLEIGHSQRPTPSVLFGGAVANPIAHRPPVPVRRLSHHSSTVVRSPSLPSPAGAMWERVVREESGMPNGCPGRVLGPEYCSSILGVIQAPGTYFLNLTSPGSWPNVAKTRLTTRALRYATRGFEDAVHDMLTRLHLTFFSHGALSTLNCDSR